MMACVSVYMPTRNRRALVQVAVESVLAQSFGDLELVVVDEGSQDGTRDYLEDVARADPRVRVLANATPQGAPRARNRAIIEAKGEFVTGLDDDDAFEPYRLDAFVKAWRWLRSVDLPCSCLYSQDRWIARGSTLSLTARHGSAEHGQMFSRNHVGNQIFAPKSHFVDAGLFDAELPAWQDFELFYRILKSFGVARLVDVPSYIFEVDARPDRISVREANVRSAYQIICRKHLQSAPLDRQRLALQMFSEYYGIRPKLSDLVRFSSEGPWLKGHLAMARALLRRPRKELGSGLTHS